ncbi:MAG: GNAT family N-acetyltransferase [Bacteroidota bacterium]
MNRLNYRKAQQEDVPLIVHLLADDKLGSQREQIQDPLPAIYYEAFSRISADTNQELWVVEMAQVGVIGTFQLSFIPYLSYQGGIRAQIEAVRIRADYRGQGIGKEVLSWVIQRAKEKGAHLLQLTSNKQRSKAIRFYEQLGFISSHEGMKLHF